MQKLADWKTDNCLRIIEQDQAKAERREIKDRLKRMGGLDERGGMGLDERGDYGIRLMESNHPHINYPGNMMLSSPGKQVIHSPGFLYPSPSSVHHHHVGSSSSSRMNYIGITPFGSGNSSLQSSKKPSPRTPVVLHGLAATPGSLYPPRPGVGATPGSYYPPRPGVGATPGSYYPTPPGQGARISYPTPAASPQYLQQGQERRVNTPQYPQPVVPQYSQQVERDDDNDKTVFPWGNPAILDLPWWIDTPKNQSGLGEIQHFCLLCPKRGKSFCSSPKGVRVTLRPRRVKIRTTFR